MISAELCWVVGQRRLRGAHVVAHRVGCVERLPTELHKPLFAKRPFLAYAGIDVEHAVADDVVADSGLARPLRPECRLGCGRIGEDVGAAHTIHNDVLGVGRLGRWSVRHGIAFDVPVGGPGETVVDRDRETGGPAEYAGDVPTANYGVEQRAGVSSE